METECDQVWHSQPLRQLFILEVCGGVLRGDVRLGQAEELGPEVVVRQGLGRDGSLSAFETATAEPPKGQKNSQDGEWGTDMKDSWL